MNSRKILVAYTTNAGSTTDVAQEIATELGKDGLFVDVKRLEEVANLEAYAAVVVGAPMIVGWHREAVRFVKKHQSMLHERPVGYFFIAMNLTDVHQTHLDEIPLWVDPLTAKPPLRANRLSIRERYALPVNYLQPVLKAAPQVKPVSVGFFGGKLAMYNLKWWQAAFVLLVIQARPGGSHNHPFIQEWAADLQTRFSGSI